MVRWQKLLLFGVRILLVGQREILLPWLMQLLLVQVNGWEREGQQRYVCQRQEVLHPGLVAVAALAAGVGGAQAKAAVEAQAPQRGA